MSDMLLQIKCVEGDRYVDGHIPSGYQVAYGMNDALVTLRNYVGWRKVLVMDSNYRILAKCEFKGGRHVISVFRNGRWVDTEEYISLRWTDIEAGRGNDEQT